MAVHKWPCNNGGCIGKPNIGQPRCEVPLCTPHYPSSTRHLILVTGGRLVVQCPAHVHPQPRHRRLVSHPHIVNRPHLGRRGHPNEAAIKRLVTPKDQRSWHPTGCPTETLAVVNQLQHLQKSACIDIRTEHFGLNFSFKFRSV